MPPLNIELEHEDEADSGAVPVDELARVAAALAPGMEGDSAATDEGLALLAHILEKHASDATTAAVLLSGVVPRLIAALERPATSVEGCVEGLRALVFLLDVNMRDARRRIGGSGSGSGAPPQHHPDPKQCEVCNADRVASEVCSSVTRTGAPRAAVTALGLHQASRAVAYFACADLHLVTSVEVRARDARRNELANAGAMPAIVAAARRFTQDVGVCEQALSALFVDRKTHAAALAAGGGELIASILAAHADAGKGKDDDGAAASDGGAVDGGGSDGGGGEGGGSDGGDGDGNRDGGGGGGGGGGGVARADGLLEMACRMLVTLFVEENEGGVGSGGGKRAVAPAAAVPALVRVIAGLGVDARRSPDAVTYAAVALSGVVGAPNAGAMSWRSSRTGPYLAAMRAGATCHILAALRVHGVARAATASELLQALARVVLEDRQVTRGRAPEREGEEGASDITTVLSTQASEVALAVRGGAVPLVLELLAAHDDSELSCLRVRSARPALRRAVFGHSRGAHSLLGDRPRARGRARRFGHAPACARAHALRGREEQPARRARERRLLTPAAGRAAARRGRLRGAVARAARRIS